MNVVTKNMSGLTWRNTLIRNFGELYKDDDYKVAFITMPKDYKFEFPDVTTKPEADKKQEKESASEVDEAKKQFRKYTRGTKQGVPSFFGL